MRAAVFQGVGQPLSIEEVPEPEPLPRFAVVRVGRAGSAAPTSASRAVEGFLQMPPGSCLGHEYAGEVVAVGPDVERLRGRRPRHVARDPRVRAVPAVPARATRSGAPATRSSWVPAGTPSTSRSPSRRR